eukprot:Skav204840  [mRNA]  locus=scaffold751:15373:22570:+ [translate_table: standard]
MGLPARSITGQYQGSCEEQLLVQGTLTKCAATHIHNNVDDFGFRCLATTAWAFATAKQRHARLFRSMAAAMLPAAKGANCQEMANTAWAFGTADFHDDALSGRPVTAALQLRLVHCRVSGMADAEEDLDKAVAAWQGHASKAMMSTAWGLPPEKFSLQVEEKQLGKPAPSFAAKRQCKDR